MNQNVFALFIKMYNNLNINRTNQTKLKKKNPEAGTVAKIFGERKARNSSRLRLARGINTRPFCTLLTKDKYNETRVCPRQVADC